MNVNANVKTMNGERVLPTTHVKNVFDNNGLNLEEHLKIIYSAIGKTDIKRVYLELSDITDSESPSTFDILSAMANNTIALISCDASSPIVEEIGARSAGVLILVKKTSVYYSCGMFFTYRYGETFTGVAGLAGESFVWSRNVKPIHSLHSGSSSALTMVNAYEKVKNWGGVAVNPRLNISSDGTITIPANVNHLMISAYVVIESVANGTKFIQIFKNNAETNLMIKSHVTTNGTLSLTPLIMEVVEGDTIDLRVYSNSLDTLRFKHLTIEIID